MQPASLRGAGARMLIHHDRPPYLPPDDFSYMRAEAKQPRRCCHLALRVPTPRGLVAPLRGRHLAKPAAMAWGAGRGVYWPKV
jgi:hypothetical protein